MTLDEYLKKHEVSMKDMAKELCVHYVYLSSVRRKINIPSKELANRIEIMTGGLVTADELRRRDG